MLIPYNQIRSHYEYLTPMIIERSQQHPRRWLSPYCEIDWMGIFSPIENQTWQAIRGFGQAPFYPQYPVGKYFTDFGNPYLKISIECDGHDYHLDKEKDNRRDEDFYNLGWSVYRIPGKDCVRPIKGEYYELDYVYPRDRHAILSEFYYDTIEGLIKALAVKYFDHKTYYDDEYTNELWIVENCLEKRRSSMQQLLHFRKEKTVLH